MVDDAGFIRAIQGDPHDDVSRLIYADWLEERGDLHAADYLRTELRLAKVPIESREAAQLRKQLWQAWAAVDQGWLMAFTQPRMLRANPTPFPGAWMNFDLGTLREGEGTYSTWPYDSVPALPIEALRGEFQYLKAGRSKGRRGATKDSARYRQEFDRMVADAAGNRVPLPGAFLKFMSDPVLQRAFDSVTDCFFTLPDEYSPIRGSPSGEGMHVHFYCDSQSCLLWDLYVHANGGHCVIARSLDYFDPEPADPAEEPSTRPGVWFVAPSFEAFVYRVWMENQIWCIEHADFLRSEGDEPPPITPEIQAYTGHYRAQHFGREEG